MAGKVVGKNGNAGKAVKGNDVKILVVGDRKCGKTLFIKAFTKRLGNKSKEADDAFEHAAVYSAEYYAYSGSRSVKVFEIADVPEDIVTEVTKEHFDSNGIVFMYAIDNPSSFERLTQKWIQTVEANGCKDNQPSILIGNKRDQRENPMVIDELARNNQAPVTYKQGEDLQRARSLNAFFETKSTDENDKGVQDAFDFIVKIAIPHWKEDTGLE